MGVVIDSLKQSLRIIRDNKIILAITWVYVLTFYTDVIFEELNISRNFLLIIITPLFLGGTIGLVLEGIERPSRLSSFAETGEKNYVKLLISSLVAWALISGPGYLLWQITLSGKLNRFGYHSEVFFGTAIMSFLFLIFFQFYAIGIVAQGYGILETFKRSYEFTRKRLKAVLFFLILRMPIEAIETNIVPMIIFYYNKGRLWNPLSFYDRHPDPMTYYVPIDLNLEHIIINLTSSFLTALSIALVITFTAVFYLKSQNTAD